MIKIKQMVAVSCAVLLVSACASTDGWEEIDLNLDQASSSASAGSIFDGSQSSSEITYRGMSNSSVQLFDLETGKAYRQDLYAPEEIVSEDMGLEKKNFDSGRVTVYSLDEPVPVDAEPRYASEMIKAHQAQQGEFTTVIVGSEGVSHENAGAAVEEERPALLPMKSAGGFKSPFIQGASGQPQPLIGQ